MHIPALQLFLSRKWYPYTFQTQAKSVQALIMCKKKRFDEQP